MEDSVGRREDLIAALIPDPPPGTGGLHIGRVAHAPLTVPDPHAPGNVRVLGSIEAHRTEDLPPFTDEELARLRHLASLRGAAMAREAAAARDGMWSKAG